MHRKLPLARDLQPIADKRDTESTLWGRSRVLRFVHKSIYMGPAYRVYRAWRVNTIPSPNQFEICGLEMHVECLARGPFMPVSWPEVARVIAGNPYI